MMQLKVLSQEKSLYSGPVYSVIIPTKSGEAQILQNHAESFFVLVDGNITIQSTSSSKNIKNIQVLNNGIAYFNNNILHIVLGN